MRLWKENEQSTGKRQLTIFVDANTIVSGLIFEGNEALLLRLGRIGLCKLITTHYVIDEVTRALHAAEFRLSEEEIITLWTYTNKCIRIGKAPNPSQLGKYSSRLTDKKDVHVLAGFSELNCDILVTGDKELLRKMPKAKTTRQALDMLLDEHNFS